MNFKQKTGFIEGGMAVLLDKALRLSISIVIWILSSDTICQLNQFHTKGEAAMLSIGKRIYMRYESEKPDFYVYTAARPPEGEW